MDTEYVPQYNIRRADLLNLSPKDKFNVIHMVRATLPPVWYSLCYEYDDIISNIPVNIGTYLNHLLGSLLCIAACMFGSYYTLMGVFGESQGRQRRKIPYKTIKGWKNRGIFVKDMMKVYHHVSRLRSDRAKYNFKRVLFFLI